MTCQNGEPMTLKEIADHFGVSHQAIAGTMESAFKKIRKALKAKGIYNYADISIGEVFQFAKDHQINGDKEK